MQCLAGKSLILTNFTLEISVQMTVEAKNNNFAIFILRVERFLTNFWRVMTIISRFLAIFWRVSTILSAILTTY